MNTAPQFVYVTPAMKMAYEVIACEATAGNNTAVAVGFLPRMFSSARDGLAAFFSAKFDFYKATAMAVEQDKILHKLAGVNYAVIAPLKVTALEGFVGSYDAYGKQLITGFDYYRDYTAKDIVAYRALLGSLVSSKSSRIDLRDVTDRHKIAQKEADKIDAGVASFFARGSHIAIVTVGDVLENMSSLPTVFKDSQTLIQNIKEIDPKKVQAAVQEVNDLVALFVGEIEAGNIKDLSRPQVMNLVEGIMALAKQVEFFALTYYRAATYVAAVERLTEVLKKA